MYLAFNCEIKMVAQGRNSAYYVFVLLDPFPRVNHEDVEYPISKDVNLPLAPLQDVVRALAIRKKRVHVDN